MVAGDNKLFRATICVSSTDMNYAEATIYVATDDISAIMRFKSYKGKLHVSHPVMVSKIL